MCTMRDSKPSARAAPPGSGSWKTFTMRYSLPSLSLRARRRVRGPAVRGSSRSTSGPSPNRSRRHCRRAQRRAHLPPERVEAIVRHMRQPEAHEHEVVARGRLPREQVGDLVVDVVRATRSRLIAMTSGDASSARSVQRAARARVNRPRTARELERARRLARSERRGSAASTSRTSANQAALSSRRDRSARCETTTRRIRRRACGSTPPARRGSRDRSCDRGGGIHASSCRMPSGAVAWLQCAPCNACPSRANAGKLAAMLHGFPVGRRGTRRRRDLRARRHDRDARRRRRARRRRAKVAAAPGPDGLDRAPAGEAIDGPRVTVSGWALDPAGMRAWRSASPGALSLRRRHRAARRRQGASPALPTTRTAASSCTGDFVALPAPAGADRRALDHRRHRQGRPRDACSDAQPHRAAARARWSAFTRARRDAVLSAARAFGHRSRRRDRARHDVRAYLSARSRAGFRVPILYLRTTKGAARRLRVRSRLGSHAQMRRATHRRGLAQRRARACAGAQGCRCSSRSTAASGPMPIATSRSGTSTTSSSRTRRTASGTRRTR